MRRSFQWTFILGVLLALTLGVAACGGDDDASGSEQGTNQGTPAEGKKGGKLTSLWTDDVDNIDCGITYYQMGFQVCAATQKSLYGYKPEDADQRGPGPGRVRSADLRGRQDRHGEDQVRRQVLAARRPRGHLQGRQVRDRARLLQHGQQRLRGRLLRRPRGREGRRQAGSEDQGHHDARRHDDRVPPDQGHRRRRRRRARAAALGPGAGGVRGEVRRARTRRCTARTRSRPVRT